MKLKNIISIHRWQGFLSMVNCQLLIAMGLMILLPLTASAQYDDEEEEDNDVLNRLVTAITQKKKQYETRTIKGRVLDAATNAQAAITRSRGHLALAKTEAQTTCCKKSCPTPLPM